MSDQNQPISRKLAGEAMPGSRQAKFGREKKSSEFEERVIEISRVSRVVKGGRRIRFRVLVIIGDQKGRVGYGVAKANEIAVGVKKAVNQAKKHLISLPIINDTIPYQVTQELGSAKIMLKPAALGTSVVAGGVARVIAELAGIKNLVAKVIGTANKINNVKAIFAALSGFDPEKVGIIRKRAEKNTMPKPSTNITNVATKISDEKIKERAIKTEKKIKIKSSGKK